MMKHGDMSRSIVVAIALLVPYCCCSIAMETMITTTTSMVDYNNEGLYFNTIASRSLSGENTSKELIVEQQETRYFRQRKLLDTSRIYPECRKLNLSPEDCQVWIQSKIEDAGGHEVGDINIKIHTPRTTDEFNDSYWMVDVPINIYGDVACDHNEGVLEYPYPLQKPADNEEGFIEKEVNDFDCYGLTAGECCRSIFYNYGYPTLGRDVNGQCVQCFVHREPLIPVFNKYTGNTDYLDYHDNILRPNFDTRSCVQEKLDEDEVDALDLQTADRIETAITRIEKFLEDEDDSFNHDTHCSQLFIDIYDAAYTIPPLNKIMGQFACEVCIGRHDSRSIDINGLSDGAINLLEDMLSLLKKHRTPKSSKENCIIIYTNTNGEIIKDPKLGGGVQ